MTLVQSLVGVIVALFGGLLFINRKKSSAEALVDNQKNNEQLNKLDQGIAKNTGLDQAEQAKREQIEKDVKDAKTNPDLLSDLNKLLK